MLGENLKRHSHMPDVADPAMRDWRRIFGQNVRRIRKPKGLTQEQLAFDAEIDLTYMCRHLCVRKSVRDAPPPAAEPDDRKCRRDRRR
jgi:hypothetical protein